MVGVAFICCTFVAKIKYHTNTRLIYNYIAHIIKYQEAQTIPDCIRYITCVFCYNFKSQSNILASY